MPTTYVNDLRLSEMATGEQSGTWGTVTNTNLELIGDALGYGTEAITTNADTHASTIADGSADAARAMYIKYTGTLDSTCTITIGPNTISRVHIIENATSGSQSIIIKQGTGATVTIGSGAVKVVYLDGAGAGAAVTDALVDLDLTGTTTVATLTASGVITGSTVEATGDTSAGDNAAIGYTSAEGLILTGQGSTNDVTIKNDADADVLEIPTGTTNVTVVGDVTVGGTLNVTGDTAAGDDAAIGYTSAEGLILTGQGSTNDVTIKNDADADVITIATGTTVVGIPGSLDVEGDIDVNGTANLDVVDIDGAVDMASTLQVDGAITSSSGATITTTGQEFQLTLTSTDADALQGPRLKLYRNSSSPADGDATGEFTFVGRNDNSQDVDYFQIRTDATDVSDGSEDATVHFFHMRDGTQRSSLTFTPTETIFNDDHSDLDFRVESDAVTNALFVDGATGYVSTGTLGADNVRLGVNAGDAIASGGDKNTLIGDEAGSAITTGDGNTAVGYAALKTEDAHGYNTAIGREALEVLDAGAHGFNVAVGYAAGHAMNTGIKNTLIGTYAGDNILGGTNNVTVGYVAGDQLTSGVENTLIGAEAGDALTDADYNVAVGKQALTADVLGSRSTAVGFGALQAQSFSSSATDSYNTAVGMWAGKEVTTGTQNTCIGGLAGDTIETGTTSTLLGYNVDTSDSSPTGQIVIGSNINSGGSNTVKIGVSAGNASLDLDGSDTSWSASSDLRLKKDVATCDVGLDFIKDLRPITYKWNAKNAIANTLPQYDADSSDPVYGSGKTQHGFIAQEVKTAIDAHSGLKDGFTMWNEEADGTQQVAPSALIPMLVKAIQELSAKVAKLEGE